MKKKYNHKLFNYNIKFEFGLIQFLLLLTKLKASSNVSFLNLIKYPMTIDADLLTPCLQCINILTFLFDSIYSPTIIIYLIMSSFLVSLTSYFKFFIFV